LLNESSGIKGLCGVNDMREVVERAEAGDEPARLALSVFCYRIRKYVGAYLAVLGAIDALVFTGGVGENRAEVRALACEGMEKLGIRLDARRNASPIEQVSEIQASDAEVKVLVVQTNEELEIANETMQLLSA
jgi:acetate kinase